MLDLNGLSKAHLVVLTVKQGVVRPNEHITQNPQWTSRRRDIQSHESTQTDFTTSLFLLYMYKGMVYLPRRKSVTPRLICNSMWPEVY